MTQLTGAVSSDTTSQVIDDIQRNAFEYFLHETKDALKATELVLLSAPNKTVAQVGEKAGWLRAMGSSRRSA